MPQLRAEARRIRAGNAVLAMINVTNSASETRDPARVDCKALTPNNTAPIAATPAAFPICAEDDHGRRSLRQTRARRPLV